MERVAEELCTPGGAGGTVARQIGCLLQLSLIDHEAHALSGDPRIVRRALGERGERVEEKGARLMHTLTQRRLERAVAIDTLVRLLPFLGRIPVRAHRAATAVMNHARRRGVRGAAL